jgi:hypothetical protein
MTMKGELIYLQRRPPARRVVTQFEIGARVLIAGRLLHTQTIRPQRAVKFKLSHYRNISWVLAQLIDHKTRVHS